jgi:MraZ protein
MCCKVGDSGVRSRRTPSSRAGVAGLLPLRHPGSDSSLFLRIPGPLPFHGTFEHSLDAKNRLTIPATFRGELSGRVIVAKGVEPCVAVYAPPAYDAFTRTQLGARNPASADFRRVQRFYAANAFPAELDSAGRIVLPTALMEHARLERDVVVIGADDRVEIWDRGQWASYNADLTSAMENLSESLGHPS